MPQKLGDLALGSKVKFGSIYGLPIVWLVADKNHDGFMGSYPSNSVTLFSEKIIKLLCFDAAEPNRFSGYNVWKLSNLNQWLNSGASAGKWYTAQHSTDAPPSKQNVYEGYDDYDTEAGFLYSFTEKEQNALLEATVYYEALGPRTCVCKVFCPNRRELALKDINESRWSLFKQNGSYDLYARAYPTEQAVYNSGYKNNSFNPDSTWSWWLRDEYSSSVNYSVLCVGGNGSIFQQNVYVSNGLRPACNISYDTIVKDSVDSDGCYNIIWGTAPSVPNSINVPATVNGGGQITISWVASSDAENNLAGYKAERNVNNSTSWTQIYQGSITSCTDNITKGWNTVQYRVKAYDTDGLESGWRTSPQRTVINNTAPSAPSGITVPDAIDGGSQIEISWGAATDPDNNLSGYRLERKVGNDAWTQIYQGANLSFLDSITKGWVSVQYRVKAFDSDGSESGYTTGPVRNIDNNSAPGITTDSPDDLGIKNEKFSITYTVTDSENDIVTVRESIDKVEKRSFNAVLGEANSFNISEEEFIQILNGPHTLDITATDSGGKSSVLSITFTKAVHSCGITMSRPMLSQTPITKTVLHVARNIPEGSEFQVMVTNNANDPEPVWEDATAVIKNGLNYLFENKTAQNGFAFNFVITASRGSGISGGFIDSVGGAFE